MRKNCNRIVIENYYEPCILYFLSKGPGYGYAIQKHIESQLMCTVNISNVYRCLSRLYQAHYVLKSKEKSEEGPDRVVYRITADGHSLLQSWVKDLKLQKKVVSTLITNCKNL